MAVWFEGTYTIDSRQVDCHGQCRPSALLGILQEAATLAAVSLHVSREEMLEKYHAFWMLARIWYRLERPLRWGETVAIRTWHRGGRGAAMYRDFDLFVGEEPVGEAVSVWVLADWTDRKLLRLGQVEEFAGTDGGELCKAKRLHTPQKPAELAEEEERLLRYSDCDVNGHVNNARYADLICDALHMEKRGEGRFVSSLQVGYLRECRCGETLRLYAGEGEEGLFVHGEDRLGEPRFEGVLTLEDLAGEERVDKAESLS